MPVPVLSCGDLDRGFDSFGNSIHSGAAEEEPVSCGLGETLRTGFLSLIATQSPAHRNGLRVRRKFLMKCTLGPFPRVQAGPGAWDPNATPHSTTPCALLNHCTASMTMDWVQVAKGDRVGKKLETWLHNGAMGGRGRTTDCQAHHSWPIFLRNPFSISPDIRICFTRAEGGCTMEENKY